ncbi:hypothetical protein WA158_000901 [Blastocystis sp. Blastoise]
MNLAQVLILLVSVAQYSCAFSVVKEIEGSIQEGSYASDFYIGYPLTEFKLTISIGDLRNILYASPYDESNNDQNHFYNCDKSFSYQPMSSDDQFCKNHVLPVYECNNSKQQYIMDSNSKECTFCSHEIDRNSGRVIYDNITMFLNATETPISIQTSFFYITSYSCTSFPVNRQGSIGISPLSPLSLSSLLPLYNHSFMNIVTLCMGNYKGQIAFGNIESTLFNGDITWIPTQNDSYYSVLLNDIKISKTSIHSFTSPIVASFDSSLPFIYLPSSIYMSLKSAFQNTYCSLPGVCSSYNIFNTYCLTSFPSSKWPPIDFYIQDIFISIPSSLYFYPFFNTTSSSTVYCFSIKDNTNQSTAILGNAFLRSTTFLFNNDNNTIGIATPSSICHCEYTGGINVTISTSLSVSDILYTIIILSIFAFLSYKFWNCYSQASEEKQRKSRRRLSRRVITHIPNDITQEVMLRVFAPDIEAELDHMHSRGTQTESSAHHVIPMSSLPTRDGHYEFDLNTPVQPVINEFDKEEEKSDSAVTYEIGKEEEEYIRNCFSPETPRENNDTSIPQYNTVHQPSVYDDSSDLTTI